jgi:hypothetical protein
LTPAEGSGDSIGFSFASKVWDLVIAPIGTYLARPFKITAQGKAAKRDKWIEDSC